MYLQLLKLLCLCDKQNLAEWFFVWMAVNCGLYCNLVQVGIAKITGKAFVDGQKVLEVKEFTCDLVK